MAKRNKFTRVKPKYEIVNSLRDLQKVFNKCKPLNALWKAPETKVTKSTVTELFQNSVKMTNIYRLTAMDSTSFSKNISSLNIIIHCFAKSGIIFFFQCRKMSKVMVSLLDNLPLTTLRKWSVTGLHDNIPFTAMQKKNLLLI